jgi:hypothetical protein
MSRKKYRRGSAGLISYQRMIFSVFRNFRLKIDAKVAAIQ